MSSQLASLCHGCKRRLVFALCMGVISIALFSLLRRLIPFYVLRQARQPQSCHDFVEFLLCGACTNPPEGSLHLLQGLALIQWPPFKPNKHDDRLLHGPQVLPQVRPKPPHLRSAGLSSLLCDPAPSHSTQHRKPCSTVSDDAMLLPHQKPMYDTMLASSLTHW